MLLLTLCLPATAAWQLHTCHIMQTTQARCASHTAVPQRLASFQRTPVGHVVALATASQDELIATLRRTPESEMEPILANNIKAIDQLFFLRLAEMSDEANDELERDEIGRLASTVAKTIEGMLQRADALLEDDAAKVQGLMAVMASGDGTFTVPVPADRLQTLREAIRDRGMKLDDTFVATVKAYMSKANDDGLDDIVEVLRILLQVFAAERLLALAQQGAELDESVRGALKATLEAQPTEWDEVLRAQLISEDSDCDADSFLGLLQDKMGEIVLGMPSGSALQALLAEYLSELLGRARAVGAEAA